MLQCWTWSAVWLLFPECWSRPFGPPCWKEHAFWAWRKGITCAHFFQKFEALDISRKAADLTTNKVTGLSMSCQYLLEQIWTKEFTRKEELVKSFRSPRTCLDALDFETVCLCMCAWFQVRAQTEMSQYVSSMSDLRTSVPCFKSSLDEKLTPCKTSPCCMRHTYTRPQNMICYNSSLEKHLPPCAVYQ